MTDEANKSAWTDWLIIAFFIVVTIYASIKVYNWAENQTKNAKENYKYMNKSYSSEPTATIKGEIKYKIDINGLKYEVDIKEIE